MARKQRPYPPEFRREIVGLVRSGRSPESLAREFELSAAAIRKWVKQADLDEGHRSDGLTTFERQELRQARRAVFDIIEGFYNRRRRHSALGYESPYRYEQQAA